MRYLAKALEYVNYILAIVKRIWVWIFYSHVHQFNIKCNTVFNQDNEFQGNYVVVVRFK